MGGLVAGELGGADQSEEGIVDDLDEPDQADHRSGRGEVGREYESGSRVHSPGLRPGIAPRMRRPGSLR